MLPLERKVDDMAFSRNVDLNKTIVALKKEIDDIQSISINGDNHIFLLETNKSVLTLLQKTVQNCKLLLK